MAGSTTSHSDDGASIVLALGGGGARGLAQIGVIEVLQARGLYVEAVAGTSCGALVGGAFAAGTQRQCDRLVARGCADRHAAHHGDW